MCEEWLYVVDAAYDDVDVRSEIFYNRNGDIFDLQVFVQFNEESLIFELN